MSSGPFADQHVQLHPSLYDDSAPTGKGSEHAQVLMQNRDASMALSKSAFSINVHRGPCGTCGGLLCSEGTETGLPSSTLPPGTDAPEKACSSAGSA